MFKVYIKNGTLSLSLKMEKIKKIKKLYNIEQYFVDSEKSIIFESVLHIFMYVLALKNSYIAKIACFRL